MMEIIRKIVYFSHLICIHLIPALSSASGVVDLTSAHTCVDINQITMKFIVACGGIHPISRLLLLLFYWYRWKVSAPSRNQNLCVKSHKNRAITQFDVLVRVCWCFCLCLFEQMIPFQYHGLKLVTSHSRMSRCATMDKLKTLSPIWIW